MSLSIGIVGLPNVGKSTLFNALLRQTTALAANYPFATIEPNIGIAPVPDARLAPLAKLVGTTTIKPATIQFVDIAGLVAGASRGEGLGNQFLAHIRETSAIAHVLRAFTDAEIIREGARSPLEDLATIRLELQLADLATLEKQKPIKGAATPAQKLHDSHVAAFQASLNAGHSLISYLATLPPEEAAAAAQTARELNLLTSKREIFVFNVDEDQLVQAETLRHDFAAQLAVPTDQVVIVSAKIEAELATLPPEEAELFLAELGLTESGLARLATTAYHTLGLQSYLTAGELEVRAWTIPQNTPAPQAAAAIHTDFTNRFIKAKVISYSDFLEYGGWKKAAEVGRVRTEGKDYLLTPDDIVEFMLRP